MANTVGVLITTDRQYRIERAEDIAATPDCREVPGGRVYTCPVRVNADMTEGDTFAAAYETLQKRWPNVPAPKGQKG